MRLIKNIIRTIYIWLIQWYSLISEDNDYMLFNQNNWKPFSPSFYKTHTEEEIAAAIDVANKELDELLRMIEEKRKEIDGHHIN